MDLSHIFAAIYQERERQEQLKAEGKFSFSCADVRPELGDIIATAVLTEEVGEVAREAMAMHGLVRESPNPGRLRKELVQVAAVAVAWIESLDARYGSDL